MASKNKKTNKVLPIVITIIVILGLAAAIGTYTYLNRYIPVPDGYVGNTTGNLNNRGLFCESDGYIYFSNPYDMQKLYKMKLDGTEAECIRDVPVEFINVYGKKIYFYQTPGGENQVFGLGGLYGVCYTDIDGKTGLNSMDKAIINSMCLYGDNIYFQNYDAKEGLTLHRISGDGKVKEKISDKEVFCACPYDGVFLTYNTENGYYLSYYNPSTDSIGLLDQIRAYNIINEGNYLYYMNIDDSYKIYRYNLSSKTQEKLTDYKVDLFNVYGNNIFFQRSSETEPAIMRMNIDGSGEEKIMDGNFSAINCTSTMTFFYNFKDTSRVFYVPTNGGTADLFQPQLK